MSATPHFSGSMRSPTPFSPTRPNIFAGACCAFRFGSRPRRSRCCSVCAPRWSYLQVVQHRHYQTLAETNRIAIVPIVPNRGVIRDRNGIVLAQSYSAYTLEIQPARIKDLEQTIDALAEVVEIQPRDRKRF